MKGHTLVLVAIRASCTKNTISVPTSEAGGFLQMRGYPKRVDMVKQARDAGDAARLWEISEKLTGVRYDLPA